MAQPGGARLGTLYLVADTRFVTDALRLSAVISLLVLVLALGPAYLIARALEPGISRPILALAETARAVSERGDYTVRAARIGDDEVGTLTVAFNRMLAHIEDQERQLRLANADLERRIAERTRALEESNLTLTRNAAELQAANTELDAFAYSVSHDLRAPLRGIDGFSQVLLEDHEKSLDEAGRDALHRVRAAARRMGTLIDDLLKLARVTRAELRREPVDLSAMAREVAADLRKASPDRSVDVEIADGLSAEGDSQLLRLVLENLLGNAWKYTGNQQRARIEFTSQGTNGDHAFVIRDNGAGFDMKYADKLFGVFQRLHSAAEFAGTGVGLASVRRIILRHGGKVWAEAAVGSGATFYFTLETT